MTFKYVLDTSLQGEPNVLLLAVMEHHRLPWQICITVSAAWGAVQPAKNQTELNKYARNMLQVPSHKP